MAKKTRSYNEALLEALADPLESAHYLNAAMDDSNESFLKALKNVAQARQMTKVARDAGVQRETLYRSLSGQGNPTLSTLSSVLKAIGLKLFIDIDHESELLPAASSPPRSSSSISRKTTIAKGQGTRSPEKRQVRAS